MHRLTMARSEGATSHCDTGSLMLALASRFYSRHRILSAERRLQPSWPSQVPTVLAHCSDTPRVSALVRLRSYRVSLVLMTALPLASRPAPASHPPDATRVVASVLPRWSPRLALEAKRSAPHPNGFRRRMPRSSGPRAPLRDECEPLEAGTVVDRRARVRVIPDSGARERVTDAIPESPSAEFA